MATTTELHPFEAENRPTKVKGLGQALEIFLRHTSPWLLAGALVVAWSVRIWMGSWSLWDLAIGAAVLAFWPIQEWLIHVFILHFKPRKVLGVEVDMHAAEMHRIHHRIPWVLEYVFVPLRTELATLFVGIPAFLGLAWVVGAPMQVAMSAVAVFAVFGMLYEWTHFLVHTNYRPKSKFYRRIWENHRWHHFKNENFWFGVSRLAGDTLLGTNPDPKTVDTSPTCRTLGVGKKDATITG